MQQTVKGVQALLNGKHVLGLPSLLLGTVPMPTAKTQLQTANDLKNHQFSVFHCAFHVVLITSLPITHLNKDLKGSTIVKYRII